MYLWLYLSSHVAPALAREHFHSQMRRINDRGLRGRKKKAFKSIEAFSRVQNVMSDFFHSPYRNECTVVCMGKTRVKLVILCEYSYGTKKNLALFDIDWMFPCLRRMCLALLLGNDLAKVFHQK